MCTLSVTFAPKSAGPRYGATELLDANGNVLGTTYLQANGLGPQVAFAPVMSSVGSGFQSPTGVAVDGAGNVYVADAGNTRVVKEIRSGNSYTQSPATIGSGFDLYAISGIAVDGAGNVFIGDSGNMQVVKEIYSGGTYTQSSTTIGSGLSTYLSLAIDGAGNLYMPTPTTIACCRKSMPVAPIPSPRRPSAAACQARTVSRSTARATCTSPTTTTRAY